MENNKENQKCFFCESKAEVDHLPAMHNVYRHKCDYCGIYLLDRFFRSTNGMSSENKFKIACVLNERQLKDLEGIALDEKTDLENPVCGFPRISVTELLDSFPKNANDILNRTLLNLSRLTSEPFNKISLNDRQAKLNLFINNLDGYRNVLNELSRNELIRVLSSTPMGSCIVITSKGFETIEKLKTTNIESKQAFVAMWFDNFMDDFYDNGICKAIKEAGYNPFKINSKNFNGKICDEIIAEIRRSKFLIADFTGQRGGVYFEAGFAHGLGREVIFTVNKKDVDNLHFDTRQYNHIVYESPEDLYKQLLNRIRATII